MVIEDQEISTINMEWRKMESGAQTNVTGREGHALTVSPMDRTCPIGESVGERNIAEERIPVFSCEGGCIRGEIARRAANLVAKDPRFARACHGEAFTIPHSAIGRWVMEAPKVVLIDGCFLGCHKRIIENLIPGDRLVHYDALSHYKRYTDRFEADSVPEEEIDQVARDVADWVSQTYGARS
jgi:uncharacterized metal-binding protein